MEEDGRGKARDGRGEKVRCHRGGLVEKAALEGSSDLHSPRACFTVNVAKCSDGHVSSFAGQKSLHSGFL